MVPRSDGRDAQKRGNGHHPHWMSDDGQMATSSPTATAQRPITTDDGDDARSYGPPSSVAWARPTSIPPGAPAWVSKLFASPDTLLTSTIIATLQPTSHQGKSTMPASESVSEDLSLPSATATVSPGFEGGPIGDIEEKVQSNHGGLYAAAGVLPVVVIGIIGFVVFFCLRKRRKQRQITAAQANVQEMKFQQSTVQAYMAPTGPVSRAPSYTAPSNDAPVPTSLPPVILGPISAGSNSNYMTGIDTSEVLSTRNERTGLGDPFADGNSLLEEPPPPYKPRSLASRQSSIRMPRSSLSTSSSHRSRLQPLRNPFEDPREDDDAVSQMSDSTLNKIRDNMSVVSDLSYQQEPEVGRGAN